MAEYTDPLANVRVDDYSPANTHLKTYTAGEDKSRLAAAAKELGLQQARKPRRQVRKKVKRQSLGFLNPQVVNLLLDSSMEDARIRAIYSSHDRVQERDYLFTSLPDYSMDLIMEEGTEDEDDEIDPHAHGVGGDLVSAVLGIIKGMVGPAILYLPHGFASAGYVVAIPIMALCTALFLYSSSCLLEAWQLENKKMSLSEASNLMGGGPHGRRQMMLSYPELAYRALGSHGESIVKTGIALMQSGVCLTYLIFVPQNLHASMKILTGMDISPNIWLIVMVAIQVPLSWIRDIRKLTPTNLLANCLILYGLITCLGFATYEATSDEGVEPLEGIWDHMKQLEPFAKDWFLFIGTSVLLFEGSITLLVPLQEAVVSETQRAQFPSVYKRVIMGIICFYAFFGITCWMAFGNEVRTVLTTSLPSGVLATTVQLAYSVAVIFTFPLQNFPALEIATRTIGGMLVGTNGEKQFWSKRNFIASVLVGILAIVAVCTMESLDKVVSLMGSLLGCPIAFVFPPLIHSQLDTRISTQRLWLNRFVAGMGFVAMILASVVTLLTWN